MEQLLYPALPLLLCAATKALGRHIMVGQALAFQSVQSLRSDWGDIVTVPVEWQPRAESWHHLGPLILRFGIPRHTQPRALWLWATVFCLSGSLCLFFLEAPNFGSGRRRVFCNWGRTPKNGVLLGPLAACFVLLSWEPYYSSGEHTRFLLVTHCVTSCSVTPHSFWNSINAQAHIWSGIELRFVIPYTPSMPTLSHDVFRMPPPHGGSY